MMVLALGFAVIVIKLVAMLMPFKQPPVPYSDRR